MKKKNILILNPIFKRACCFLTTNQRKSLMQDLKHIMMFQLRKMFLRQSV